MPQAVSQYAWTGEWLQKLVECLEEAIDEEIRSRLVARQSTVNGKAPGSPESPDTPPRAAKEQLPVIVD